MICGLYISTNLTENSYGGSMVAKTNYQLFKNAIRNNSHAMSVNRNPIDDAYPINVSNSRIGTAISNVLGLCATLTKKGENAIYKKVREIQPSIIWLDSSLLGCLIPRLRIESPGVKIICFFHNIEEDIIREMIKKRQWLYFIALLATKRNERMSAQLADVIVAIQDSDAQKISKKYGRTCNFILPVCIEDAYPIVIPPNPYPGMRYALFVGSDFPPNIEALKYLSQKIAPMFKDTILLAVGNGLHKYESTLSHDKIIIKGYVSDLAAIYYHATAVIAPIFSGGGMKVKIAEALMHDKSVVGSTFSFIGYEKAVAEGVCFIANTPAAYVELIEGENRTIASARNTYHLYYDIQAGKKIMFNIINSTL